MNGGGHLNYRFDCRYLLAILNHADKALPMNRVWAWQDVETADHNLKESEEWKVLSKKKDLSKAVLFHPTTNYWNTLTGIVTNTTVDIWNQQTYTLNSYKVKQAPPGMGVYPSPLLHPHPHPQHTHTHCFERDVASKNLY